MPLTLSGNGTISDLASAPTVGGTALPTNSDLPTLSTLGIANHNNISVDSSGRMTNSSQVTFLVSSATYSHTSTTIWQLSEADRNVGNHFNTTNYKFTAPATGNYLFVGMVRFGSYNNYIHLVRVINDVVSNPLGILPALSTPTTHGGFTASTFADIVYLTENDSFYYQLHTGGEVNGQSYMAGYLLG